MKSKDEELQDLRIEGLELRVQKLLEVVEEISSVLELQQKLNKQVLEVIKK